MSAPCPHAAAGCNYPEGDCHGHCTIKQQPKALRLADRLTPADYYEFDASLHCPQAAAELRRQHAENEDFRATCDHLTRENAEQIGEIVALKEQRDELLEALEEALNLICVLTPLEGDTVRKCRTAITKAGGAA